MDIQVQYDVVYLEFGVGSGIGLKHAMHACCIYHL